MPSKAVVFARPASALLPVANRPLLGHVMDWLSSAGIEDVAVVTASIPAADVRDAVRGARDGARRLHWLERPLAASLASCLHDLKGFLEDQPSLVHLGDSLSREPLRKLVVAPADDLDGLLLVQRRRPAERDDVVEIEAQRDRDWSLAGVLALGAGVPSALGEVGDIPCRGLDGLACCIRELGGQVDRREAPEWWRFRPGGRALLEANRFALEGLRANYEDAAITDSDIQGPVVVHPTSRVESSVVRGPAILGPGTTLRHAYVGPYTSIGPDVSIDGTEIEHSVVLEGASISNVGGRLEGSVIGPRARLFRDFKLPKALRVQVGDGAEIALA